MRNMKLPLIIGLMIFILMGGICSASDSSSGYEPFTVREGMVDGGLYWDSYYYASWNGDQLPGFPNTVSKTFTLPDYTDIDWAMLVTTAYCGNMENNYPGWANVTFNDNVTGNESLNVPFLKGNGNVTVVNDHTNRVTSDYLMWYDVTGLIQAGDNTAIVHTEKDLSQGSSSFDGRIKIITLVVAYNDGSDKEIYYWINRGHDTRNYQIPCCGYTNFTTDILPSTGILQDANLSVVHHASNNGVYSFNGNSLVSTPSQGEYSGSDNWNVTDHFNSINNNTLAYSHDDFDYYKIILALFSAEYESEGEEEPDLIVTAINAYHYDASNHAIFNLSNEVDVTVENIGNATASASKVSLYADDVFIGTIGVSALAPGTNETVQLIWTPTGTDCEDGGSPVDYSLKAIADCDGDVVESDENNNESSIQSETVYWNGFMADEHLTGVLQGTIQGGLYYTTGDAYYSKLWPSGPSQSITYNYDDIFTNVPSSDDIELTRLFVYYTWSRLGNGDDAILPVMEVSITNSTGTHIVTKAAEYNDRICPPFSYDCYYGSYVYDITDCVEGDNTIDVTVKNVGPDGSTVDDKSNFCPAAPGIVVLYEDDTKPEYDYWLIEGADLLEGGRRGGAYYLSLDECIFNATFPGTIDTEANATLGIVSAWGGELGSSFNSYYWFNNNLLGDISILNGYGWLYDRTVDSMHMSVGNTAGQAQIGANVSDVTGDLVSTDNTVTFGDDGDSMMPVNAFLLVEGGGESDCGNLNGDEFIDIQDVILLRNYVGYPGYTLQGNGNVNGDEYIDIQDVILLQNFVGYPGYELNCS
jgi:hypothetical protein